MAQELRGSEFAKKRYMKYDFNVYWKKHALYFGYQIQRAYHCDNNKACALYRVVVAINPDEMLIIVADSLDNIKAETKGYRSEINGQRGYQSTQRSLRSHVRARALSQ